MALVAVQHSSDERRQPDRREAVFWRQRRETIESRVDENRPVIAIDADVVQVEIAGEMEGPRDVAGVEDVVDALMGGEHILEPNDLGARRQRQPVRAVDGYPHRLRQDGLMEMRALGTPPEEIENARLVGRKRDRDVEVRETRDHAVRERIFDRLVRLGGGAVDSGGASVQRIHPSAVARIGARSVKTCGSGQRPGVRRADLVVSRGSGPPWRYRPCVSPIGLGRAGVLDACSIGVSPSRKELYDKLIGVCLGFASCRKTEHRRVAEPLGFKNVPSIPARTICILPDPYAVGLDFRHDRTMRHSPSCFHNKEN